MLVVLLGLGAYVYFIELPKVQQEAEKPTVLTFEKEAVDTLTLTYPEREIRLQQTAAGEWDITAPIQAKADDTAVNNMLTTIVDEEVTRSLTPEEPADSRLVRPGPAARRSAYCSAGRHDTAKSIDWQRYASRVFCLCSERR